MKRKIFLSALALSALAASAQTVVEGTKFSDNWSVEINAGGVTPLTHSAFFKNMRPAFGFGFSKQLTPIFGLGFQGMGYVNTSESKTAFDASDVSALGKVNLMNLFGSYQGMPRVFEVEAVAGIGWLHYYQNGPGDDNALSTRMGLNLNFNLGQQKAWTLGIKPAVVYNMDDRGHTRFNANNASFELVAGLSYHFACSNGNHYFTRVRVYDQDEVNSLNAQINNLRAEVDAQDAELAAASRGISQLKQELTNCRNKPAVVQPAAPGKRVPESVVAFRVGSANIDASQMPNVERVATYMAKHPETKVIIKGYASPEGNLELNQKLAAKRAESVKNYLIKRYKIDASRITAEGQGIGDMFAEADWNRVSICTIENVK